MNWSILGFGGLSVAIPTHVLDDACNASERTGHCVVLFWPCGGEKVAAIVCDSGLAVWGCVEDSEKAADEKAQQAIREVYPASAFAGYYA